MEWFIKNLKEYGNFKGRARRTEYWMFTLFAVLVEFAVMVVGLILDYFIDSGYYDVPWFMILLITLYSLVLIIPSIAIVVRRLHDTNRSGWWYFISLVPFVGGLVLFIFLVLDSTPGANQYGPNPKGI